MFHRNNLESTCTYICNIWDFILSNRLLGDTPHNCSQYHTLVETWWQSVGTVCGVCGVCVCAHACEWVRERADRHDSFPPEPQGCFLDTGYFKLPQ